MTNKLYTLPSCGECIEVEKLLEKKGIDYIEINAATGEGRKEFQKFYQKNKKIIERNGVGQIILPIFSFNFTITQGLERITEILD